MREAATAMTSHGDLWFGALVLAIFVPLCIVAGYLIVRFQNWRVSLHWRPLLPLFDPVSIGASAGGGPGIRLRGTHRGRVFAAAIAPGVAADVEGDDRYNEFTLALLEVPGANDWCVVQRNRGFLGLGKAEWHVEAGRPALADGLRAAGVVEAALALGGADYTIAQSGPVIAYRQESSQLVLRRDTREGYGPAPATLRDDMGALLHWAEVNTRLNPPPARSTTRR